MIVLIGLFSVVFVSWFFVLVNDPLMIGFLLIFCSVAVSFFIAVKLRVLLAMLVFLTYVGGIIVLFLYVLRVCPNQKLIRLNLPFKLFTLFVSRVTIRFLVTSLGGVKDQEVGSAFHIICFYGKRDLYVFLAVILLYTIILVCYVCAKKRVALRSFQ